MRSKRLTSLALRLALIAIRLGLRFRSVEVVISLFNVYTAQYLNNTYIILRQIWQKLLVVYFINILFVCHPFIGRLHQRRRSQFSSLVCHPKRIGPNWGPSFAYLCALFISIILLFICLHSCSLYVCILYQKYNIIDECQYIRRYTVYMNKFENLFKFPFLLSRDFKLCYSYSTLSI